MEPTPNNQEHHNKVFISHASLDYRDENGKIIPGNAISQIMKVLDSNNIDRWVDETGLLSAKGWCQQIEDALNQCNIFLYVSSVNANKSPNTANEIAYALEKKKHIIPFKLDNSPYHKDIRLNLIRLQFLRYYEDREKALKDLVASIKGISTDVVELDTTVKIKKIDNEEKVGDCLLSEVVLSLFTNDTATSVERFNELIKVLDCESEKGYSTVLGYIKRLSNIGDERNYNVKQQRLARLVSDIKEDTRVIERHVKIVQILLKMYLYYRLNDIKEVCLIQKEVDDVVYTLNYLEKNADKINEYANAGRKVGAVVVAVASIITGKANSVTRGVMHAGAQETDTNVVKTSEQVQMRVKSFETLKEAVKSLIFFEA